LVGNAKSGIGTGAGTGASVCPAIVGTAEIVGADVVGLAEGTREGAVDGASESAGVGAPLGVAVGDGVVSATHEEAPALTQRGEKLSNCCRFSNTDANPHNGPVLFEMKLSTFENELPKTTTLDTPTSLSKKQVFSIVKGPRVSTRKLFVVDRELLCVMSLS